MNPEPSGQSSCADMLIIGAGFGGICMGIKAKAAGLNVVVLERADDIGGTWRENVYPGCACDTQSHHYSFSFFMKSDWARRFAGHAEILAYLHSAVDAFELRGDIRLNQTVRAAHFDEEASVWSVKTASGKTYRALFVVSAVGQLNQPAWPDIPGLDAFSGKRMHSAKWDASYDLTGKDVAVIGNGASAVQLIPEIAKKARHLTVFQRSPNWVVERNDRAFREIEKKIFRWIPLWAWLYRSYFYWRWEKSWPEFIEHSRPARKKTAQLKERIAQEVKGSELAETLTPTFPLGCRRILLSDDYYPALQRDNVILETTPIAHLDANCLITTDGAHHYVDCLVAATGFHSHDFLPGVEVIGLGDADLHKEWEKKGGPEAYLGIAVAGFPNMFFLYGPNTNLGHSSIIFMIECQVHYILKTIGLLKKRGGKAIEITHNSMEGFNQAIQKTLKRTAWAGSCNSWYKNAQGKIINNWSTHTVGYWLRTRRPIADHYLVK